MAGSSPAMTPGGPIVRSDGPRSMQMQQVRPPHAEYGHSDADKRQQAADPGKYQHAGDDGSGRQHDADLEGGRGELEMMIFGGRLVAFVLGVPGLLGELLGAFAGLRLGTVARGGLLP